MGIGYKKVVFLVSKLSKVAHNRIIWQKMCLKMGES